jgi:hypothetical protein
VLAVAEMQHFAAFTAAQAHMDANLDSFRREAQPLIAVRSQSPPIRPVLAPYSPG